MTILMDERRKYMLLGQNTYSTKDGEIPAMNITDTQKWLLLPNDTSLDFLHAPIKSGGLGIPEEEV